MDFKIMKKIVFGLLMTMGMLNAQNNLVFNQVLLLELSTTTPAIVPEGKVWKIEGFNSGGTNVSSRVSINDNIYYLGSLNTGFNSPTWLPENTEIKKFTSSNANTFNVDKISVLEFDVVPTSTGTGSGTGGGGVSSDGLVFEEAMSITLTRTQDLNSNTSLFGEITVPEGKILKVFNVSTYALSTVTGSTQSEGSGIIYIGDELFYPSLSNYIALNRFLPSGTHTVKMDGGSTGQPNRIVVNALLYSIP